MHIEYTRLAAIRALGRIFHSRAPSRVATCHRICWNAAHVLLGDQVAQRLPEKRAAILRNFGSVLHKGKFEPTATLPISRHNTLTAG
jgi:hypothetical protein